MVSLRWLASAILLTSASTANIFPRATVYEFVNPPAPGEAKDFTGNPIFVLGQTERLELTTAYHDFSITIFQESLRDAGAAFGPSIISVHDGAVKEFDWKVQSYDFNLSSSNVFYLLLSSNVEEEPSLTCHYFNITDIGSNNGQTSSTSTAAPSSFTAKSSTSSSSTVTSSTVTSSATSAATSSSAASPPATLSTGAQVGIGIGAGLAGLASFVIAIIVFRQLRKPRANKEKEVPQELQEPREYYKYFQPQQEQGMAQMPPAEIDSNSRGIAELPGVVPEVEG